MVRFAIFSPMFSMGLREAHTDICTLLALTGQLADGQSAGEGAQHLDREFYHCFI